MYTGCTLFYTNPWTCVVGCRTKSNMVDKYYDSKLEKWHKLKIGSRIKIVLRMKSIKFEKLVQFIAFIKSIELPLNSRFFVKTSSFSAIFIYNFPTLCTLHHLSSHGIQYNFFTPAYTDVHGVKLNQARPVCLFLSKFHYIHYKTQYSVFTLFVVNL